MTLQSCTPELVAAARDDPAAFAAVYRCYVTRVYRFIFHQVNNTQDAEDLTAQVFISAWEALPNYKEKGFFTAWIFGIARNKVRNFHRNQHNALSLDQKPAGSEIRTDPDKYLESEETRKHLKHLIAGLPQEKQEILSLRFAGELTYRQIGAVVGKSEGAIKMEMGRLLDRLRDEWKDQHE